MPESLTGSMLQRPRLSPAQEASSGLAGVAADSLCVIEELFGISRETFVADYLGKAPLIAQGSVDPLILAALPTADRAAALVPLLAEHPDSVRFARSGDASATPAHRFPDGSIDLEALWSQFRQGASVVLNNIFKVDAGCKFLCEKLFLSLGHHVQANAYLTPASASAFRTHYDTHDVIVVQLSGKKRWHLFDRPESIPPLPLHFDPAVTPQALEAMGGREVELEVGSALYLPRGYPHRAGTQDEGSFHITFGLVPITGADLLKTVLDILQGSVVALREHITPDLLRSASAMPDVRAMAGALIEAMDERVAGHAFRSLRKQALKAARLTAEVPLDLEPGAAVRLAWRFDAFSEASAMEDGSLLVTNGIKATRLSGADIEIYHRLREPEGLRWAAGEASVEIRSVVDRLAALGLLAIWPSSQ